MPCSSCLTLALGVWPVELCALARPSRLTDELVKEMLKARKAAGVLNEETFDEIETDPGSQED